MKIEVLTDNLDYAGDHLMKIQGVLDYGDDENILSEETNEFTVTIDVCNACAATVLKALDASIGDIIPTNINVGVENTT